MPQILVRQREEREAGERDLKAETQKSRPETGRLF